MRISAILLAVANYRTLAPLPWIHDGAFHAGLHDCLRQDHHADIRVLPESHLASPATALRSLASALRDVGHGDLLVLGLAGHLRAFQRRSGTFHAIALPGSLPGRPGSAVSLRSLAAAVHEQCNHDTHVLICADVVPGDNDAQVGASEISGELSGLLGDRVSLLLGTSAVHPQIDTTGHQALAVAFKELTASGCDTTLDALLDRAVGHARARNANVQAIPGTTAAGFVVAAPDTTEPLAEYIRADLFSADPGSRLDAVAELAPLADQGNETAGAYLSQLARDDTDASVRSYADILLRQNRQPTLNDLRKRGVILAEVYNAASDVHGLPDLVEQPSGTVVIGADDAEGQSAERPRHRIDLGPFRLGRTPVTNLQYLSFLISAGGPCPDHWATDPAVWTTPDLPVVMVSWLDAMRYCTWMDTSLRMAGVLAGGERITLPSEAEWECAAGSGRGDRYPWGQEPDTAHCNIRATGVSQVLPAGRFSPQGDSPSGCVDLIGNVWEWTRSAWGRSGHAPQFSYPYDPLDGRESSAADSSVRRVIRGGAFYYATECANTYTRNRMLPTDRHPAGGFRVAAVRRTGP